MDNANVAAKLLKIISNDFLELIILPTEQCNFRCTYCYEDFSIGRMSPAIIEGIKKLISNRAPDLKILKLAWFGGEPMAAKNIVFEICEYAIHLKNQYKNLHYESSMTTNGYHLNEEMLRRLVSVGVKDFQISLDGPRDIHNLTRVRADGAGTFDKIWNNLLLAKKSDLDFKILLRIHVTPENYVYLPSLMKEIAFEFKNDPRFKVFFKAIENLGGPNSKSFKVLYGKDKQDIMKELSAMIDSTVFIEKIEDKKPYICYAAQANSFLIRANGRLGKCTVALSDERNDIGSITPEGEFILDSAKFAPWVRGISTLNLKNLECPMINFPENAVLGKKMIPVKVEHV